MILLIRRFKMRRRFAVIHVFLVLVSFSYSYIGESMARDIRNDREQQYVNLNNGNVTTPLCRNHHTCRTPAKRSSLENRKGCHCDSACQYFNDCCYNYVRSNGLVKEHEEMQRIFDDHLITLEDWKCVAVNKESYWIVSRCRKDVPGIIAERCHNPVCNDTLSSIPVTDSNGVTYRNVYCAVCHNVEVPNLTAWKVEANCDPAIQLILEGANNVAPDMNSICSSCKLSASVPQTLIDSPISTRRCAQNVISKCNTTRLINGQHSDIQEACESYMALININETIYKNPHCLICNHENITWQNMTLHCGGNTIPRLTDKFLIQNTKKIPSGGKHGKNPQGPTSFKPTVNAVPLSIILDFGSGESSSLRIYHERKIIKETLVSCPNGQVYAEHSGRGQCLTLSCPVGTKYINGDCVSILSSSLEDRNSIEWCGVNSSNRFITLTATFTSPISSCQNRSFIALNTDCLMDAMHLVEIVRSCKQIQSDVSEISVGIEKVSFQDIQQALDHLSSSGLIGSTSNRSICGESNLRLIQTCHDHNDVQSCQSEWQSAADFNDTNHVVLNHDNSSLNWQESASLMSRDVFTISSSGARKHSEFKLCNTLEVLECPLLTLNSSLFATVEDGNGTITYLPDGTQFSSGEYIRTSDERIKICNFLDQWSLKNETRYELFFAYSKIQTIMSITGTIISMVAAAATFITFSVFPSLRNTTSRLIMSLIIALVTGQLLLLVAGSASFNETICFAVAVASHYIWLVVFTSMNALAFDLDRTFGHTDNLRSLRSSKKRTSMYILYSWGSPLMVIAASVFMHHCQCTSTVELRYGSNSICWIGDGVANLTMFATPAATLLVVNLLLYGHTVAGIWTTKRATSRAYSDGGAMKRIVKELGIYVKLSTLLGFTWTFGFIASFTRIEAIWYVFIVLNSLQGLFIFLSFTFNGRVATLWRRKLSWKRQRFHLNLRIANERTRTTSNTSSNNTKVTTLSYNSKSAYADVIKQIGSQQR